VILRLCAGLCLFASTMYAEQTTISTKPQTWDYLQKQGWKLPEPTVMPFEGALPIKDERGQDITGTAIESGIRIVNAAVGFTKTYKPGDTWTVRTTFADETKGEYTFLVHDANGKPGVSSYTARVGLFQNKPFALLDLNANGAFNDADADAVLFDKTTLAKCGEPLKLDGKSYGLAASPSGDKVVIAEGQAAVLATALPATGQLDMNTPGDNGFEDAWRTWNAIRAAMGAPPVKNDPELEKNAYKHLAYMEATGKLAHGEDKNHPNYSPEGHRAGMGSCLGSGSPTPRQALMGQLDCFLHRIPLIKPSLEMTCIAHQGRWAAFDHANGARNKSFNWVEPIVYPPPNAINVVPFWSGAEGPCPIPGGPPSGGVGLPITITFPPNRRPKDGKLSLHPGSPDAEPVDGWLSNPENPAVKMFGTNMETICFIPKVPLQPDTVYHVKVSATVEGQPFERTWAFTTGQRQNRWGGGTGGGQGKKGGK
jgi:hypothetical protein